MKNIFKKISLAVVSLLSIVGVNLAPAMADIPKNIMEIKETSPLYLEHAANIFEQNGQSNSLLAWHYSHESHGSHGSHGSHQSHYSHYSGY